ncbi:hypothetical protein M6B22_13370 [Jatrophihabitans cynanchi]|jgi:hypothetical protein|uniref:Restriction endonuclease n=1 Tax=Jatrophihabitans cynanchi TaxID=2944128 RepID=A0ABY7JV06_9ACTN|nr:hypothetical protein [Jatrophihabitans sp. SB3-54]WAX55530.1 hypothetical protein M6B22_13370 [Jatrophihabitans sp. SB3-54]
MGRLDDDWLASASASDLLAGYAAILRTLRERGVVRSANAPVGDYAELLVAQALNGELVENFSVKSYDLDCPEYQRVQVKARLVSSPRRSGQLQTSPFRSWDFDHAALVLVDADTYMVEQAVLLPVEAVQAVASHRSHVNGAVVQMNAATMQHPQAVDITDRMRAAAATSPTS